MVSAYEILEVKKTATQDEIKSSYRRLAKKYHPDVNPGNKEYESKFKEIASAYEQIGTKEKRDTYDRSFLENPKVDYYDFGSEFTTNFASRMNSIFSKSVAGKIDDIIIFLDVSLEEINKKPVKQIKFSRISLCNSCRSNPDIKLYQCEQCFGTGAVKERYTSFLGVQTRIIKCKKCNGRGQIQKNNTCECFGTGMVKENHSITFKFPDFNSNQFKNGLEFKNVGNNNWDKERGKVVVKFIEKKHQRFTRQELDLYSTQRESLRLLILGGEIQVKSLDSTLKIKVEPNSEGTVYRLKGKGLLGGDLYVTLEALVPKINELSEEQLRFLDSLYDS